MSRRRCRDHCKNDLEVCPIDTIVFNAVAHSYRDMGQTALDFQRLNSLMEGPNGYLAQYYNTVQGKQCSCKENAKVFANAIIASVDAVNEFHKYPPPGTTNLAMYPLITGLPLLPGGSTYDPALGAFIIINLLLDQYTNIIKNCGVNPEIANVFAGAFENIYNSLLTAINSNPSDPIYITVVDLTYISAVAHYVDVQLKIEPKIPILEYIPV